MKCLTKNFNYRYALYSFNRSDTSGLGMLKKLNIPPKNLLKIPLD